MLPGYRERRSNGSLAAAAGIAQVLAALAVMGCALAAPGGAIAKDWSGVRPGVSTMKDVKRHLGEPTKEFKPSSGAYVKAWSYQFSRGLAKRKGVRQANFYFDSKGICRRIDMFPSMKLKLKDIEAAYGDESHYRRGLTSAFQRYVFYSEIGLAAFIEDDGETVFSLQFLESMETRRKAARPVRRGSHDTLRFKPTTKRGRSNR